MHSEILSVFEKQMRLKGLARQTIKSYTQSIKDFFLFSRDMTIDAVAEYLNQKKIMVDNRQLSRSHYNQVQYAFDKYWQLFYAKRLPILNRVKVFTIPPKVLSEEQVINLLAAEQSNLSRMIISLGYFSMLRRGEIWKLNLYEDIDTENRKVYVRAGKGFKPRVSILSDFTARLVNAEREERKARRIVNPWLCAKPGSRDRYLCYSELGKIVKAAAEKAKIEGIYPHLLRHTGATHLDLQGVSTRKIQRLEGHESLTTTQRYITHTQDQVLEVKNKLDVLLLQSKENSNNV